MHTITTTRITRITATLSTAIGRTLLMLLSLVLVACGGGSGEDVVDISSASKYTVTVGLSNTSVTASATSTVTVTLRDPGGNLVSGGTVELSSNLGVLSASSITTNGSGVGTVTLTAGTVAGSGQVTGRYQESASLFALGTATFTTAGDAVAPVSSGGGTATTTYTLLLSLVDASSASLGSASNPLTQSKPGTAVARIVDSNGTGVANTIVSFSTSGGSIAILSSTSSLTDSSGYARVSVTSNNTTGAATLTAAATAGTQNLSASLNFAGGTESIRIGSGTGAGFTSGALTISPVGTLAQGATATVSVNIVDGSAALYTATPVTVSFSSTCASLATPTATIDASATTSSGTAAATYRVNGCSGTDTITASVASGSQNLTATSNVSITPPTATAIAFISATPTSIALQGTGGAGLSERSIVKFKVTGEGGTPIASQSVNFALSTSIGGTTLSPATASTDSSGFVQTEVQAGTVPTSLKVLASIASPSISVTSDQLAIGVGLPDQNSFSLSMDSFNPEGADYDGQIVNVTVRMADHFNNPVPDGTSISFQTELGAIEPFCATTAGACSVKWISQNPRNNMDCTGTDRPSRSTILATAVGTESFSDVNGNGRFDDGEPFTDLAEAFVNENENSAREAPTACATANNGVFVEEFRDFDEDNTFDAADGKYNGTLCATPGVGDCSATKLVHVRASGVIVMASSTPVVTEVSLSGGITGYTGASVHSGDSSMAATPQISLATAASGSGSIRFTLGDIYGNAPPKGSTVTVSITSTDGNTNNKAPKLSGNTSITVGSARDALGFGLTLAADVAPANTSDLLITVTTPKGNITTYTYVVKTP